MYTNLPATPGKLWVLLLQLLLNLSASSSAHISGRHWASLNTVSSLECVSAWGFSTLGGDRPYYICSEPAAPPGYMEGWRGISKTLKGEMQAAKNKIRLWAGKGLHLLAKHLSDAHTAIRLFHGSNKEEDQPNTFFPSCGYRKRTLG